MSVSRSRAMFLAGLMASVGMVITGCRGSVSMDLSTDAPADPQIVRIDVDVTGVEFQRADGGTRKLEFVTSERTNLIALLDNPLRLFTDEELADGSYTGVRLLLEDNDDATVALADGREFRASLGESRYASADFTVAEDKSSHRNLALTLDLRKSLGFDDSSNEYLLSPSLRSVDAEEAGQINGAVSAACPPGSSLQQGGAVYLFEGADVEPDEVDGSGVEPYATTAVISGFGTGFSYVLRSLPPGDYTIAATCNGNLDEPATDDGVSFLRSANVRVDADAVTYDIVN